MQHAVCRDGQSWGPWSVVAVAGGRVGVAVGGIAVGRIG